jgi:aryl-alcohol dehydrogenase-like predicted oxidoreductase
MGKRTLGTDLEVSALGLGCMGMSFGLGKGFLTGAVDENTKFDEGDFRNTVPRFNDPDARKANLVFVQLLGRIAERNNARPAQIALAWLLAQKAWIAPIPGTTKVHRLEENVAAADVELTADDLREIGDAQLQARGHRYGEASERMVDR